MAQSRAQVEAGGGPAALAMVRGGGRLPAWVERGGASHPSVPGVELKDNDQLKPARARGLAFLGPPTESAVKLARKRLRFFLGGMQMARETRFFTATHESGRRGVPLHLRAVRAISAASAR